MAMKLNESKLSPTFGLVFEAGLGLVIVGRALAQGSLRLDDINNFMPV